MNYTYVKEMVCPYCNHPLNNAANLDNKGINYKPNALNVGLCWYCVNIVGFLNGELIKLTDDMVQVLKTTKPKLYNQITEAAKTIKETKNEPSKS